jgi:hypothetical protein
MANALWASCDQPLGGMDATVAGSNRRRRAETFEVRLRLAQDVLDLLGNFETNVPRRRPVGVDDCAA